MPIDFSKYQQPATAPAATNAQPGGVDFSKYQKPAATPPPVPDTPWYDKQLVHPETWFGLQQAAKEADDAEAAGVPIGGGGTFLHMLHGALQSAGSMTTAKNALVAGGLGVANLIPGVGEVVDGTVLGLGAKGIFDTAKDAIDKTKAGDIPGAEESLGQGIPNAIGTVYGTQNAYARSPIIRFGNNFSFGPAGRKYVQAPDIPGGGIASPVTATVKGLGNVANNAAEGAAESALGVTNVNRAYNKSPGKAILDSTKGFTAEKVKTSGEKAMEDFGQMQDNLANQHVAMGGTISLNPALRRLDLARNEAEVSNNPDLIRQIDKMKGQLSTDTNGMTIPPDVPAPQALSLLKGFRDQYTDYRPNSENTALATSTANQASHDLANSITTGVKSLGPIRQQISNLYPVVKRADITDRGAGIYQQVMDAMRAKTGALAGTLAGAGTGFVSHGVPGLVGGALGGAIIPRLLASDRAQLGLARGLYNAGKGLNIAAPYVGDAALKLPIATTQPMFRVIEPTNDEDDQY